MKTRGLDRIAILVRDFEAARTFFSKTLGVELTVCGGEMLEAGGVQIAMSFDEHLEIISPIRPLKDSYPDVTKQMAATLDASGSDSLIFGLTFRVDDADQAVANAGEEGLRIVRRLDQDEIPELGVRSLNEIFLDPGQACGLNIGLVSFEESAS